MKNYIKDILGITTLEVRIEMLERLLLHRESYLNGYGVLKKHLQRPDRPLPTFAGKEIEQD